MTVSELMANITTNPNLEGIATADDMVFAMNIGSATTADVGSWVVAQAGITEISGSMSAQTAESQYLRTGVVSTKTGNSKSFVLQGERYRADPFQEALLTHELKWGTGALVVKEYVYFDMLTGKGEKGQVSVNIESDFSSAAGANAGLSAALHVQGVPQQFTYEPTAQG